MAALARAEPLANPARRKQREVAMHAYRAARTVVVVVAGALVLLGAFVVGTNAGHDTATVASYTGCLRVSQGTLSRFAVGDSPSSPCPVGHVVVHVSGGDISAVNAGTGLTGSAAQGEANLNVDFADFGSCPAGSAIRVIGTSATCETDDDTTYSAGAGLDLTGATFSVDTSAIQARVSSTCAVGSAVREINADGTVVCESIPPGGSGGGELILIQRHEFDTNDDYFDFGATDWDVTIAGGAGLFLDPDLSPYITSAMTLDTQQSPFTAGSVVVRGKRQASLSDGTLVFKTRVLDAYAETSGAVYGDAQPRGLANGNDRNNAIEFINAGGAGATLVGCRTVSGGTATQTTVDIGQWVRRPAVYQIVVTPTTAKFYVNGVLECTHTTDIPTVPLNMYFSTSDGGAGNVPVTVDWASFEQREP